MQEEESLVRLLRAASHLGAHVAYEEEAHGGDGHDDLGDPERHVPAVLFGDGAEGKPRHESPHCHKKRACFSRVYASVSK